MTVTRCDRCSENIGVKEAIYCVTVVDIMQSQDGLIEDKIVKEKKIDLCPECWDRFIYYMNNVNDGGRR